MIIESSRLLLRPLVEADVTKTYVDWLNDPEINRYLETRHSIQTLESCREFVERMNEDITSHLFGIFLKDGGVHIGNAKLGFINPHYASAEFSLFIGDKSNWGKGFMREVTHMLAAYGFRDLKLERIESGCYEDNLAVVRVLLKVGYTVEGFFRSSLVSNGRRLGCFWLGILKHELVDGGP